jgi:hypothetical protein
MLKKINKIINGEIAIGFALASLLWIGTLIWATSYAPTNPEKEACYQSAAKSGRSVDECKSFWEKVTSDPIAAFTSVLAFSTVGLWLATFGLYLSNQKQLGLARDEFTSTHRPKIRIKHVWILTEALTYEDPIRVRIVCVNRGRTRARISEWGVAFFLVKQGRKLPIDPPFNRYIADLIPLQSGISAPMVEVSYDLSEWDEIGLRRYGTKLYCCGYVHYLDDMDRLRTTAFCRVYEPAEAPLVAIGRFVRVKDPDYEYED